MDKFLLPPTMRELAAVLKVSVSTVSLALRNDSRVALETRQQVQALARERGYQLNPAVTGLMSHVRNSRRARYQETLGWLNLWGSPDAFTESGVEHHRLLWQGARQRALSLGYELDNIWMAEPGMTASRMSAILSSRGIRGLLLPPLPRSCGHLSIRWEDFTAVAMSHTIARPQLHRVVPDHHANMQLILRNLRHRGYKRPGLLIYRQHDERVENRFCSAFAFYQQGLAPRDRIPVRFCAVTSSAAESRGWLRQHRPDAVITLGALRHLRDQPLGLPGYSENLGVVLLGYAQTDLGFTAINENPSQIGSTAVDHLAATLNRNERGIPASPQTILIKGTWVEGDTLPALKDRL